MAKQLADGGLFLPFTQLKTRDYEPEELKEAFARNWVQLSRQKDAKKKAFKHWRRRLFRRKDVNGMHVG